MVNKVLRLLGAPFVFVWSIKGGRTSDNAIRKRRLETCRACDRVRIEDDGTMYCRSCMCPQKKKWWPLAELHSKVGWKDLKCPLGKWGDQPIPPPPPKGVEYGPPGLVGGFPPGVKAMMIEEQRLLQAMRAEGANDGGYLLDPDQRERGFQRPGELERQQSDG